MYGSLSSAFLRHPLFNSLKAARFSETQQNSGLLRVDRAWKIVVSDMRCGRRT
jgi:hypothetical protein